MDKKILLNTLFVIIYLLFLTVIILTRLQGISLRPMHCDEANQAYKAGILLEKGIYKYDPYEHHGPLLYYSTLPVFYLYKVHQFKDTNEAMFRIVPLLFSILLFLPLFFIKKYIGTIAFLVSSLFLAISHAFFFYSRYYIHEILFVLFATLFIFSVWAYINKPKTSTTVFTALFLSLAFATKETTVVILFSTGLAIIATSFFLFKTRHITAENDPSTNTTFSTRKTWQHLLLFFIVFIIPWILLYSSFFTNWQGLIDFFKAYQTYIVRASGEGSSGIHDKPWWYYLQIITHFNKTVGPVWTEGIIIPLCIIGIISFVLKLVIIFIKRTCSQTERTTIAINIFLFISFFSTFLLFSLIPYKTPWNILFPLLGMIIFAGVGFQFFWFTFRRIWLRIILFILLFIGAIHLGYLTYQGNYIYYADISNPYVYAHTTTSLVKMMGRIYELSDILKHENREPIVFVISSNNDYWPIPWYLRKIEKKGFWQEIPITEDIKVPFIIISPEFSERLEELLSNSPYMKEVYSIRPGVFRYLYIEQQLWDKFIETQTTKTRN